MVRSPQLSVSPLTDRASACNNCSFSKRGGFYYQKLRLSASSGTACDFLVFGSYLETLAQLYRAMTPGVILTQLGWNCGSVCSWWRSEADYAGRSRPCISRILQDFLSCLTSTQQISKLCLFTNITQNMAFLSHYITNIQENQSSHIRIFTSRGKDKRKKICQVSTLFLLLFVAIFRPMLYKIQ
jgi:hypothetical protein